MKKPPDRSSHTEATLDPQRPLSAESASLDSGRFLALYDMGQQLLGQRQPAQVLRTIHEAIVRHLQPDRGALLAVSADGSCRPLFTHELDLSPPLEQWPVSWTVIRQVLDGGLAVLASDVRGNPQLEEAESIQRFRIRSVMCVPLGEPVRGLVYLDNRSARAFTAADLEFLTAAARYASLVLKSAEEHLRTVEALELSGERLEMLQGELLRHEIVGAAPSLLRAYDALRRFARSGARVLLRGETGTGKELFARAYAANSPRPGSSYVPVPIPALAPTVVESELFGHVRGSFTEAVRDKKGRLELADRGVLFLDEVGDIDLHLQPKLLRFLDSGELYRVGDTTARRIDTLVVSATNRPLEKDVEAGRFRTDLLALLQHLLEVRALDELHRDVLPGPVLPVLVDAADAGMGDSPRELDLGAEPPRHLGRRSRVAAQDLQGDRLVQHPVVGAVHGAHPAAAERAQDLVASSDDAALRQRGQDGPAGEADLRPLIVGGSAGGAGHRSPPV